MASLFASSNLRVVLALLSLGSAGCSVLLPKALEDRPCGAHRTCSPEEALAAPIEVLRTNGSKLYVECAIENSLEPRHIESCQRKIDSLIERLAAIPGLVTAADLAHLRVEAGETCIDSFVSGNESRDCAFYRYYVTIPLLQTEM